MVVGDMPFLSYGVSEAESVEHAGRFLSEAYAQAVKVEGGVRSARTIGAIVTAGIPVMGHIGLTPQAVNTMGGFRVQGRGEQGQTILEADDASNPETAVKVATKFIKEDRVDFLMGTFNGDCALAVSALAQKEDKLFMVTGAYLPELTGVVCNRHTFVFMPNARMLAQAVAPYISKAYGTRWYMITAASVDGKAAAQAMLDAGRSQSVVFVGETVTPFGATDFVPALAEAKAKNPTAIILNLYGWDLVHALKAYAKLELAKEKIGVG
jgi:ABC-type branched-subunit amino acid transport system substrate-binding protein